MTGVSTPLENRTGLAQPQDFAPVVTEWQWPSAEDVAGDLSEDQRASILAAVSASDYKREERDPVRRELAVFVRAA